MQVQQSSVEEFRLDAGKKAKPVMRAEDQFELLRTARSSVEVGMEHERVRVQLALLLQLTGANGPDQLSNCVSKNPRAKWVPKTSMPTLNSVLSLGFADGAFEGLAGPEDLFQLKVLPGLNQQEVPIKKSKMDWPLFRGLRSGQNGHEVSETERVTDKWLRDRMKHLGEVTGFDLPLGPYCFRRGNGEALDSSSLISDSQRNKILQHANSGVYQHDYMSNYIGQDKQAIYRGLKPQAAVMRAGSGMTRSIDRQRPRTLNDR
ncbi:hypothetical protein BDY17DRAFT_321204 [Neohortaea acidophila]|uniref:Uncharacterized protein n=1 Tax=Neohortaea acidophila TaxID=245834 RepID=A0A6A6Q379_9PEZI|nr:uncharacterized protein BDY17DRAFT_321204 [Neohortaea acidophila]KAF2486406.1 hypothetical protein BDY17DRAFT_321204 [Neohortaea acidophila]